ncbi:MAG TPA: N-acetylmuramoyl-L-alanine amidase-like domain-containing protein [Elusimicrobiota bacterium]|nr:N-acetylmuramoyl-L-alanine amidase-like domain-containing protein [Elusimicrobiota bacterium]
MMPERSKIRRMIRLAPPAAFCLLAGACTLPVRAQDSASFYGMTPDAIARALGRIETDHPDLQDRISVVSSYFLGTPYVLGPLGEGPRGEFDRNPIVSFSALDCTTFVEETIAFSLEPNLARGTALLQKIRYKDGVISYQTRNHFASVDWIPNNIKAGFIKDITREIAGNQTRVATKTISKSAWYATKSAANLEDISGLDPAQQDALVARWRSLGANMPDQKASLPYVPMDILPEVLGDIPSGTIANLVRADVSSMPVLVSHQLLIIDKGGQAYVREAAYKDKVKDIPAMEYFAIYQNSKWPLLGLNLDEILPRRRP